MIIEKTGGSGKERWNMKNQGKSSRAVGIIILIAIALIAVVFINIKLNEDNSANEAEQNAGMTPITQEDLNIGASAVLAENYFESFRAVREDTREREIEYLNLIIGGGGDEATLADAREQLVEIVDCMEKELTVESLVKAKGFEDVAVTFHYGSVNIIVSANSLSEEQVAQILEITMRETGEPAQNIKISTH